MRTLLVTLIVLLVPQPTNADIVRGDEPPEITDVYTDLDEWLGDAGPVTTIDFTGFEAGTQITDQYGDLGVAFTDGFYTIFESDTLYEDGFGLDGNQPTIVVLFEDPLNAIGVLFPGVLRFDLFMDGEYVGWTGTQGCIETDGCFAGLITDLIFDEVHVLRSAGGQVNIDNVYFGFSEVPAPSAAIPLFAVVALRRASRRRTE